MCELLGMSANVPTDICFSFAGLVRRGGGTGPHGDGWGIAFYDGKACRTFHDPQASADSEIARFVRAYPIKSRIAISHIRRANRGRVSLENTHPFTRELWGRSWTFAHNGQLKGVKQRPLAHYRPIGTTDSEHAFCWMLDQLRTIWREAPPQAALDRAIRDLSRELATLGVFNLLLSDSRSLYCHCSTRLALLTRRAPFGQATLIDDDIKVDFATETTPNDVVTVVATRPLTSDEQWTELGHGAFLALRGGEVVG
ncbi:class II glutamine amidotransferase [Aliidongia dinghuensis]|uniref:Class II glutamine amidotransferase n=1 Tax=Aliidongia dinghuensis TaxID=1867774 RepID=A0A8J2YZD2_9PROT|nr:class II glutamine amidotransferase [Aliidongia dinghuensis]GGF40023.1 class II glutamine amidotransferase [Aliidongia dinghuensis]